MISRYKNRQNAIIILYIHLIKKQSFNKIIKNDNNSNFLKSSLLKIDKEMKKIILFAINKKKIFIKIIDSYLKNWRYERLGYIEKAILLFSFAELNLGFQKKNIIINEAVRIAKYFGSIESYKIINAVMDTLSKKFYKKKCFFYNK